MADRHSAKRILDFTVMKLSPDKIPPKLKTGHQRGSGSPLSGRSANKVRYSIPLGKNLPKPYPGGNRPVGTLVEYFEDPAESVDQFFSADGPSRSNKGDPNQENYSTPCSTLNLLYQLVEPEGFEEVIRKASKFVAKKENMKVQLDSSYVTNSVFASAVAASDAHSEGYDWKYILGVSAAVSIFNGIFVYFCGDKLDKIMEKGFTPELDALLLECLREAAYQYNWADLQLLASGDVSNKEIVLAFKNALDRFIQEGLMSPPNLNSSDLEIIRAAI